MLENRVGCLITLFVFSNSMRSISASFSASATVANWKFAIVYSWMQQALVFVNRMGASPRDSCVILARPANNQLQSVAKKVSPQKIIESIWFSSSAQ